MEMSNESASGGKTFCVRISQTLEGCADIKADSHEQALDIAFRRFVTQGEALPDMDDTCQLQFDVLDCKEENRHEQQ